MQLNPLDGECILGHDVAEDMVKAGLDSVTMIQRSKTCMAYFNTSNSRILL